MLLTSAVLVCYDYIYWCLTNSNNISDTKWLIGETECRSWLCFKLVFFPLVFHWLSLYRLCVTDVVVDIFSQLVSVSLMRYRYCYWFHHLTSLGICYALPMWLLIFFLQLVSVSLMRYRYCYWFHHLTSLGIGNALTMWSLLYNPSLYLLRVKHIVVSCFILHSWSQHRLYIYEIIVDLQIVWVTVLLPILLLIVCFYPSHSVPNESSL